MIAKWRWGDEDGQGDSAIYANKNGAYFTVDKTAFGGEREFEPHLTPLTREQVQNRLLYAEKLEVFDEARLPLPPEAMPEDIEPTATICVPVPMSLKRRVEVAALRSGQGITALAIQCLKERCPA